MVLSLVLYVGLSGVGLHTADGGFLVVSQGLKMEV